ncbi:MAG TPA: Wadjet anti-phage system protein JetD domain-containing protein [Variovorax sp.]|nr:Wadjet anti-phage system protein JetD domain-containing protein [Variovorax sp.]
MATVLAEMKRRIDARFGLWLLQDAGVPEGTEPREDGLDAATWPVRVPMGSLKERDVLESMDLVAKWVREWEQAQAALPRGITLDWETRQWTRLGEQRIPARLVIDSPGALAEWVNQGPQWRQACHRREMLFRRFGKLRSSPVCRRHLAVFVDWADEDVERLQTLLAWFEANPSSGLYLRQLPVPTIDTKWIEPRKAVVRDFLLAVKGQLVTAASQDFHEVCGLRKPAGKLRLRVLCPELRASLAGLCDIEAPVEEVARMTLPVRSIIIVENLETGLALPDFEGAVAFMRLGHAVSELARIPWLRPEHLAGSVDQSSPPRMIYWGDLDTHGFAILSRARGIFSRLQSILMDEATFSRGQSLWVTELKPNRAEVLPHLTPAEMDVYVGLRSNRWGVGLRLEQERLSWPECLRVLREALEVNPDQSIDGSADRQLVGQAVHIVGL